MLKWKCCSIIILLFFQTGFGQSKEEILGRRVFTYYQNHQIDSLLELLPPYGAMAHISVAKHNGDSASLKKNFPDESIYDSITRASARVNFEKPYSQKFPGGRKINWKKCSYDSTVVFPVMDTLASGEILRFDGLVIHFHDPKGKYELIVAMTFRYCGEIYIGDRVVIGRSMEHTFDR